MRYVRLQTLPPIYEFAFMSKTTAPVDTDWGVRYLYISGAAAAVIVGAASLFTRWNHPNADRECTNRADLITYR
ncbi:hypothetical protein XFF6990_230032 [Xanthomonas citri pv. fuscans]|uniref:Uncharacterized protein n=1 Tax=Xanthomonas campestris pv. phaseoli TaxID=317013 RepID=A0A7Z7J0N7_XANCH|nr:hypothetical protein XFF6990_230032 [Xanthomonas citri pv. fuscans]SOO24147.1 hypothetical protein XFF6991_320146 [Xanthomonas phaseoli pv. phaseoli]